MMLSREKNKLSPEADKRKLTWFRVWILLGRIYQINYEIATLRSQWHNGKITMLWLQWHNGKITMLRLQWHIMSLSLSSFLWDCHAALAMTQWKDYNALIAMTQWKDCRTALAMTHNEPLPIFLFTRLPRCARNDTRMGLLLKKLEKITPLCEYYARNDTMERLQCFACNDRFNYHL